MSDFILRVVAGVFYFEKNNQPYILLFERKISREKNSGIKSVFEFPGGKVETHQGVQESDQQALSRELFEELAVKVVIGPWIGHHQFIPPHSADQNKKIDLHLYQVFMSKNETIDLSFSDIRLQEHLSCIQIPLNKQADFSQAQYLIHPKLETESVSRSLVLSSALASAKLSFGDQSLWQSCYLFFSATRDSMGQNN